MIFDILIVLVLLALSFSFSGSETALFSIKKSRLRTLYASQPKLADRINGMIKNAPRILLAILIGNTLVNLAAASVSYKIFSALSPEHVKVLNFIFMSVIIIIFGEILPKTIALDRNIRILQVTSAPLLALVTLISPLIWLFGIINNFFLTAASLFFKGGSEEVEREEAFAMLCRSAELKKMEKYEKLVLLNFLRIMNRDISSLITPRKLIESVDLEDGEDTVAESLKRIDKRMIAVCRGGQDNVIGVFDKTKLADMQCGNIEDFIISHMEKPVFITGYLKPEKAVGMLRGTTPLFVVDEYGGLEGMLSPTDFIRTLFAPAQGNIKRVNDRAVTVKPSTPLFEIEIFIGADLFGEAPEEDIREYFLEHYPKMPKAGSSLKAGPLNIEVTGIEKRRITEFKITREDDV